MALTTIPGVRSRICLGTTLAAILLACGASAVWAQSAGNVPQPQPATAPLTTTPVSGSPESTADKTIRKPVTDTAVTGEEEEYRIGPQDLIEVTVYGQPELTRTVQVNSRGRFSLPLIGTVEAAGRTALELEQQIATKLSNGLLQNPQVTVFVKESLTSRFTVEGAVAKPGVYPLRGQMTLLRAIALVGGKSTLGDLSTVRIFRQGTSGERQNLVFDIEKIRNGEQPDPNIVNDDLIVIGQSKVRAALKDSVLSDVMGLFNPFSFLK